MSTKSEVKRLTKALKAIQSEYDTGVLYHDISHPVVVEDVPYRPKTRTDYNRDHTGALYAIAQRNARIRKIVRDALIGVEDQTPDTAILELELDHQIELGEMRDQRDAAGKALQQIDAINRRAVIVYGTQEENPSLIDTYEETVPLPILELAFDWKVTAARMYGFNYLGALHYSAQKSDEIRTILDAILTD